MRLKSAVEQTDVSPDLPLGERLRIIADENEPFLFENLPTQGLAVRVAEALKASSRQPLGSKLRNDPSLVTEFYNHPIVAQAHVFQGKGRFTALKVMTKAGFSVFRRNEGRGKPITLRDKGDFGYWVEQRAVEFLSEIGFSTDSKTYHTDRFLIDLDPRDHFAFDDLKEIVKEVHRRLIRHPWIDPEKAYINWTGGKGFHLVAEFPTGITHEVEAVRIELEPLIAALCDDVSTFPKPLTAVYQPHVVLDLSPVMKRGVYRNTFSFHSSIGGICIPVKPEKLDSFDPEQHANHSAVISVLEKMNGQKFESYQHLVSEFMRLS